MITTTPTMAALARHSTTSTSKALARAVPFKWTEVNLGRLPDSSVVVGNGWSDVNGWHYGVVVNAPGGGRQLWLDGGLQRMFDDFADSGSTDVGLTFSYAFSPGGERLAYPVHWEGAMHMVVDGRPLEPEQRVSRPKFSPNGQHLAYEAVRKGKSYVLLDGKPGPPCDNLCAAIVFSPDSRHIAYLARHGADIRLVVDQKERPEWPCSGTPVFSPDSKRLALLDFECGCVVVDAKKGPELPSNIGSGPVFSSDSRHFAYSLGLRTMDCWVERAFIDHRPLPMPDKGTGVWHVVFSPNLQRWGCFIRSKGDPRSERVVLDGKVVSTFSGAYGLKFSSDGSRVAFMAQVDTPNWWMVVDGKLEEQVRMGSSEAYFSPNGKRLAYIAGSGPDYWMIVDGNPGPKFNRVLSQAGFLLAEPEEVPPFSLPRFSPDSSHVVYAAQKSGKWNLVLDNRIVGEGYDSFVNGGPSFHKSGSVEMLGIRGGKLYRYLGTPR